MKSNDYSEISTNERTKIMVHLDNQKGLDSFHLDVNLEGDNRIDNQKSNMSRTELHTRCWKWTAMSIQLTTSEG